MVASVLRPRSARKPGMAESFVERDGVRLAVEDSGEGTPVVLLHGLTATRRYVVMGSSLLERSGHRVVTYDARGHGRSSPAPQRTAYGYEDLQDDLEASARRARRSNARCSPVRRWARTRCCGSRCTRPERVAGLVVITPAYDPSTNDDPRRLAHWDALADGLERGASRASSRPTARRASGPWQETVLKVLRQRLSLHEHPEAVADALRAVPRSHPFGTVAELGAIAPGRGRRQRRRARSWASARGRGGVRGPRSPARAWSPTGQDTRRSRGRGASSQR